MIYFFGVAIFLCLDVFLGGLVRFVRQRLGLGLMAANVYGIMPWDEDSDLGYRPKANLHFTGNLVGRDGESLAEYRVRTDSVGRRLTRGSPGNSLTRTVSLYGCSFTFGAAVDDEHTIGWQLAAMRPGDEILNYGVEGYSAYQALKYAQETVPLDRPDVVVLLYWAGMDLRNVGAFYRLPWFRGPYCRVKTTSSEVLQFPPAKAKQIPGAGRSYSIYILQYLINWFLFRPHGSKDWIAQTSQAVFLNFKKLAEENGCEFVVVELPVQSSNRHHKFLRLNKFNWERCVLDLNEADGNGGMRWTLFPLDYHLSPDANSKIAEVIDSCLQRLAFKIPVFPSTTKELQPGSRQGMPSESLYQLW